VKKNWKKAVFNNQLLLVSYYDCAVVDGFKILGSLGAIDRKKNLEELLKRCQDANADILKTKTTVNDDGNCFWLC